MANLPEGFVPDSNQELPAGFVPDEEASPSWLDPKKFKAEKEARRFKNQTGPDAAGQLARQREATDPVLKAGSLAAAPALSLLDVASLGFLGAGFRDAEEKRKMLGIPADWGAGLASLPANSERAIKDFRSEYPVLSRYTDIPGYFTKPAAAVAQGVDRMLPQVVTMPGRIAKATVASGGTSGLISAAQAANAGATPAEVGQSFLTGAGTGTLAGAGLATVGSVVGAMGRAVQNSKGGKARQFIEQHGGEVGPGTPGRGGPFDRMVTNKTTDEAIGQQAEASAKRGLDILNQEKRGVLGGVGREIGRVSQTPEAGQLRDVTNVVSNMEAAMSELDTSPQAKAALREALEAVRAKQGQGFNPDTDNYLLTEADVNKLRRSLDRSARTGISNDEKLHPLREAANEVRSMVGEGPYADPNARYAREAKFFQESRKLLDIPQKPKTPEEAQSNVNKVKNLITRRGQQTVTAGGQQDRLRQFEERHPDVAEEFVKPELLRKRADLSFHLFPEHGGLIDRVGPQAAMMLHALGAGATGILPALAYTNLPAIQARLLYGPALTAQAMEPLLLNEVPRLSLPAHDTP